MLKINNGFLVKILLIVFVSSTLALSNILTSLNHNCPTTCQDTSTTCMENIAACLDPNKYEQMVRICQCTCLFCPEPIEGCADVDPECRNKSYECSNNLYKPIMCKYCRKTCKFCDDPCAGIP